MLDEARVRFADVVTPYKPNGTGYLRFDARTRGGYEISSDGISTSVTREVWIARLAKALEDHA